MTITINIHKPQISKLHRPTPIKSFRYNRMIKASQKKIAEAGPVVSYTQIWA